MAVIRQPCACNVLSCSFMHLLVSFCSLPAPSSRFRFFVHLFPTCHLPWPLFTKGCLASCPTLFIKGHNKTTSQHPGLSALSPAPPQNALSDQATTDHTMLENRRYSSAPFAADQNMTLPSPAFARPEPSKRHSSFNLPTINMGGLWDPDRPTTSDSTRSFSIPRFPTFDGRRLSFQSDRPAFKPSKLQPSPSALHQSTLAPGSSGSTAPKPDNKRRSRLFGKSKDKAHVTRSPPAWMLVAGQEHRIAFDVDAMLAGERVGHPTLYNFLANIHPGQRTMG